MTDPEPPFSDTLTVSTAEAKALSLIKAAAQQFETAIAQTDDEETRGRLRQRLFALSRRRYPSQHWASQAGQDCWLEENVFRGKRQGVFVEVGAFDGINGSNTWFFETFRAWHGLLIEPSPRWASACRSHRRVPCVQVAAGGHEGRARFLEVEQGYTQMSGLVDSYDPGLMGRVKENPQHAGREIDVKVRPLGQMLIEHGLSQIDYLSLDVEGAEVAVLEAFPFDRIAVTAWSIENHGNKLAIRSLMEQAGYVRALRVGEDDIWLKKKRG